MGGIHATRDRLRSMVTKYTMHTPTNHLFEMASINVGSKDSILLQQNGHDVFKEMWTQPHPGEILVGSREAGNSAYD